jgi:hypothetical protein
VFVIFGKDDRNQISALHAAITNVASGIANLTMEVAETITVPTATVSDIAVSNVTPDPTKIMAVPEFCNTFTYCNFAY